MSFKESLLTDIINEVKEYDFRTAQKKNSDDELKRISDELSLMINSYRSKVDINEKTKTILFLLKQARDLINKYIEE